MVDSLSARSGKIITSCFAWWAHLGSNQGPLACKAQLCSRYMVSDVVHHGVDQGRLWLVVARYG
jgi:hypothetical protein